MSAHFNQPNDYNILLMNSVTIALVSFCVMHTGHGSFFHHPNTFAVHPRLATHVARYLDQR
jgi:hypothetical protein